MFYKMLSSGQLKVVLSARDMSEFGVSIDSDSLNSPDVRIVFLSLLSSIEDDVSFPQNRSTLLIEVSPTKGGGCVAVYTAIVNSGQVVYPLTCFRFDDAISFYDGAISVFSSFSCTIFKSYAFCDDEGSYYIALSTLNEPDSVCRMLSEFGEKFDSDLLTLPFMQEHFKEVPTENVLDALYEGHRKSLECQQHTKISCGEIIDDTDESLTQLN